MNENFNPPLVDKLENGEKFPNPSEAEVLGIIDGYLEGKDSTVTRRLEDAEGLYTLFVQTVGEDGELVQYEYVRKNNQGEKYPDGSFSKDTKIDIIFFMGDMPVGGDSLAKFENGVWEAE
ncbi:MAG: hypothetical protein RLZZ230_204 [Candidatus Parcubacteria bacterium]|jgi:hypothetical protein